MKLAAALVTVTLTGILAGPAQAADPCPAHKTVSATGAALAGAPVNDPFFTRQWGLQQLHVPQAWARGARGAGVVVAVLDSGLDTRHPELAGRYVTGGGDWVGAADGGCPGPEDELGHGTHVASIIGAATGNGIGGAGIASDAVLLPVRVADADGIYEDGDLAEGIDAAVRAGARVLNLSLGSGTSQTLAGPQLAPAVEAAMNRAVAAGVVVVAAAGNLSQPICAYPASVRGVICVAATDRDERPSFYSNFPVDPDGTAADGTTPVRAPGGSATTVGCDDESAPEPQNIIGPVLPGGGLDLCGGFAGYETLSGTSQAAPHVASIAAMLVAAGLNAAQVRECLRTTSRQAGEQRGIFTPAYGYGIVDAEAALATCAPGFRGDPPAASAPAEGGSTTPPSPGERPAGPSPLPSFAARTIRADPRSAAVRLSCAGSRACAGALTLRSRRRIVARVTVGVPAATTLTVRVRWRRRAPHVTRLVAELTSVAGHRRAMLRVKRRG